jgi:hypothetical protein
LRYATDRQISFLRALIKEAITAERQLDPENGPEAAAVRWEELEVNIYERALTVQDASHAIDRVKAHLHYLEGKGYAAAAREKKTVPGAEPGFYLKDDTVYRVVPNQAKTRTYAKRLDFDTGRWRYAGGIVGTLTADDRLSEADAARLGHQYGICVLCARELSDPESVARGIGPVCARRHLKAG